MSFLQNAIGSNLGEIFKDVVGEFHLSKEDQAKFQQAIDDNKKEVELAQIALEKSAQDAASAEVKAALDTYKAELTQDDKYTKRWRPTFAYVFITLIFWNYGIVPHIWGAPVPLPTAAWELFGALLTLAVGGRTFEKIFPGSRTNGTK